MISDRVKEVLEWPWIVESIGSRCRTEPGAAQAITMPPLGITAIRSRLRKITQMKEMMARQMDPDLAGIRDIAPLLLRTEKSGTLTLDELIVVRQFIVRSKSIRQRIKEALPEFDSFQEEYDALDDLKVIGAALIPAITESGELSPAAYPQLRRYQESIFALKKDIEKHCNGIINGKGMDTILQERVVTRRNDRYSLLVKANHKGKLPGNVLDVSASGATLYIEPDSIRPHNNELILEERELQMEIHRILAALSNQVAKSADPLRNNREIIAGIDLICAAALFSEATASSEPEIIDEPSMKLIAARHPMLTLINPATVPNDIEIGADYRCLIISGANTGGKTVLLKTIGLCALMAMHGLHIPASPDSRIGLFTGILADIGDDQSIIQSLSTFSGQLAVIRDMLQQATPSCLIIIDEIIVGTDPRQGAALARAVLETLADRGSCVIATTHYSELKELASADTRFRNASVSFNPETLAPDYILHIGIPGISYALEIASLCGLPSELIESARRKLDDREMDAEALIERIHRMEEEMRGEREGLASMHRLLDLERDRLREKERKIADRERAVARQEGIAFLEELKEYRQKVSEKIKSLEGETIGEAWKTYEQIRSMQNEIALSLQKTDEDRHREKFEPVRIDRLSVGDRVFVVALQKEGEVKQIDSGEGTVMVHLGGSFMSRYRQEELCRVPGGGSAGAKKKKTSPPAKQAAEENRVIPLTIQTGYNTIDLRGMRVHEALQRMESDLDHMVRSGIDCAVIIHGHGTGALKEAVRQNLSASLYVADFRRGESGEGGDGVSIALLRTE